MAEFFLHNSRVSPVVCHNFIPDFLEIEIHLIYIPCRVSNVSQCRFTDSVTCSCWGLDYYFGVGVSESVFVVFIESLYFILFVCWWHHLFFYSLDPRILHCHFRIFFVRCDHHHIFHLLWHILCHLHWYHHCNCIIGNFIKYVSVFHSFYFMAHSCDFIILNFIIMPFIEL